MKSRGKTGASDLTLGDAAKAIGVSQDTLRRWDRDGKLRTTRDANRRLVPLAEVERLARRPSRHRAGDELSARNRFPGVVRSVEVDGVMALVEIEAGPHLITAAVTKGRRRRARPRTRRAGDGRGQSDVGDGRDRQAMRARTLSAAFAAAALALALAACGGSDNETQQVLRVAAASSLDEALTSCGPDFQEARVRLSFAGSDQLAAQIRQGAKPDVYAAANTKLPQQLSTAGSVPLPSRSSSPRTSS